MAITLRAARVNKGFTQEKAAEKLGLSRDTLRHYEKGDTFPDVPTIVKIEELYGVTYNDLIFLPNDNA
jgi:transcriptional regulator with XRE-family HTH domain